MRERPTVRVILLSPAKRLLLLHFVDNVTVGPRSFWATVGGEIEEDENLAMAAAREMAEETGMVGVPIGPLVWRHDHVLAMAGEPVLFRERYIIGYAAQEEFSRAGFTEVERESIHDARWWSLDEIATTQETIFPVGIATLLPDIIAGRLPPEPIDLAPFRLP
jgi:8-oxo-dGTP pyrophosphatase MutT (NUDIX family)